MTIFVYDIVIYDRFKGKYSDGMVAFPNEFDALEYRNIRWEMENNPEEYTKHINGRFIEVETEPKWIVDDYGLQFAFLN